jgi:uncharacterized protein YndB with AHSA1/START domain
MTQFSLKTAIEIKAPASKVWKALTEPPIVKQYSFGTDLTSDWEQGSPIIWEGEWNGNRYKDTGTILEIEPGIKVKYDYWSSMSGTEDIPENYIDITYELQETNGKTTLYITQERIKTEEAKQHSEQNWQWVFEKMKELIERDSV